MNLEDYGIQADVTIDHGGVIVLNLTTDKAVRVLVNGHSVTGLASVANAQHRPTFWNPDGTQTDRGTVDLRGEVK